MKHPLLLLLICCGLCTAVSARPIRGTVKCGGRPLAGVAVTDGYTFAQSDAQGAFALDADDEALFISVVTPAGYIEKQDMAFTIALCQQLLGGEGAIRVHGGGFAGTALAFVPNEKFEQFNTAIEAALGSGCCHKLAITE